MNILFSLKSDSRIQNVCLTVCPSQEPLSLSELLLSTIEPIDHRAYQPSNLLTIEPINHQTYWPSSLLTIKPINHWAHWPLSLLTSGLLSQLLSLSACLIAPKTRNFGSCLTKWKLFQQGQKSLDAVEGETHKTYKTNNVHKSRLYWLIWLTYLSNFYLSNFYLSDLYLSDLYLSDFYLTHLGKYSFRMNTSLTWWPPP